MDRRNRIAWMIGLVLAGVLGARGTFAQPNIGDPAPNFTLPDSAGVNHSLTNYHGKVVLLNFWASW